MARATRADVAAAAGVSVSTVSHVLNGRGPELGFLPSTITRVKQTAAAMGYIPRASGRAFRNLSAPVIALVVGLVPEDLRLSVFNEVLLAAIDATGRRGHHVLPVLVPPDSPDPARVVRDVISQVEFVGAIVESEPHLAGVGKLLATAEIPFAWLDTGSGSTLEGPVFRVDEATGVKEMLGLIDLSASGPVLGLVGPGPLRDRMVALEAMCPGATVIRTRTWLAPAGFTAITGHLQAAEPPSVVFGGNDYLAVGALSALRHNGIAVPDTCQVFGWGDHCLPMLAATELSSIYWPLAETTSAAANWLVDTITDNNPQPEPAVFPTIARPRDTTIRDTQL